jgi:hypothetical protein
MKTRNVVGLIASAIIILSSFAHIFGGWPAIAAQLVATHAPADLVAGLKIGWIFGGVAIFTFGLICAAIFWHRMHGEGVPILMARMIGIVYVVFGLWALVISGYDPFFAIFLVPGAMIVFAAR